jgi:5'-nucleotidase
MPFPIEDKLVIAVSSSALFDLSESDRVFREQGHRAYKQFQEQHLDKVLDKGVAFPFIRRFLSFNQRFANEQPVEVVLLSRNSTATGRRVFRSIAHYGLDISRAAFVSGASPFPYIPAFNASLFLSAHEKDVRRAVAAGYPAGLVLPSKVLDEEADCELRIAFDFDGVLADDESEMVFKKEGLERFFEYEHLNRNREHNPGLLAALFQKLSRLQALEDQQKLQNEQYSRILRTAIITARNAPSHERVITTLERWGVAADETFFLGGMDKRRILDVFKPHIFFDDQISHLTSRDLAMVHVPFGVANVVRPEGDTQSAVVADTGPT